MAGEKQTSRAFLIIINLLLYAETKNKKIGQFFSLWGITSTDCMGKGGGKRGAHASKQRTAKTSAPCQSSASQACDVCCYARRMSEVHCWVKQQKGKTLRLVWVSTQISKHNLRCSGFSYLQNSGGTIMRMESYDFADTSASFLTSSRCYKTPNTLFPYENSKRSFVPIQFWKLLVVCNSSFYPKAIIY